MKLKYSLKTATAGLRTHKSRSALTILGIVIGITSIILIVSLGEGAKNLILGQVEGLGAKNVIILPGKEPSGASDLASLFADSLKQRELDALRNKNNIPNAVHVMPIIFGSENAVYGSEIYKFSLYGAGEAMEELFDLTPEKGFFLTDEDVKSKANVVVLGSKVKEKLFGQSEALGEKVRIKNTTFKVIGVLPQKGSGSFINFDEAGIIPHSTMQQYISGTKYFNRVVVEADSENNIEAVASDIKRTLRDLHNITDPDKDDFFVSTPAEAAEKLGTIFNALTIFLTAIAAISLIVGGIGIMNIMLVSVTERTKEIGLRKAIGATNRDILTQFLLEAVVLTGLGGVIGIILGTVFAFLASTLITKFGGLDWQFNFPLNAAILGLVVSSLVGLVFGIYPASQAAKKSPMEALRYE
ncbi:MAG: ABC transporter permease [Candidatus Paceibacterota bacterium]